MTFAVGTYLRSIKHFLLLCIKVPRLTVLHRASIMQLHPDSTKSRLRDLEALKLTCRHGMRLARRLCLGLPINIIQNQV